MRATARRGSFNELAKGIEIVEEIEDAVFRFVDVLRDRFDLLHAYVVFFEFLQRRARVCSCKSQVF